MEEAPLSRALGGTVIPRASRAEVEARLEAALGLAPGGVLASDADGTIWDGDVGIELFEALLREEAVREEAREALGDEAASLGLPREGDANALAAALYDAYRSDRYAHDRAFAMMAWAFAGYGRVELEAFIDRVLGGPSFAARVRPAMRSLFDWAKGRGVEVFVVSASARPIVEVAVRALGIEPSHVAAMTTAMSDEGVVLPRLDGPIVYGEGKLAALAALRGGSAGVVLGAFGDSAYDAALLRAAQVPVAVTPARPLVALASSIPGLVSLDL